jgi:MFS family permease
MLTLLRKRNFSLLWLAGLVSLLGNWMLSAALPFYVYQNTQSTLATALMVAAGLAPHLVLGSLAGVIVDRSDRKRMMVVTSCLQGIVVLALLLVRSPEWVWLVYAVAFLQSCLSAFFGPAEASLLPSLVGKDELLQATSLGELNNRLARLIGPPLGGLLLAGAGLPLVVVIDSVTFLIAAAIIARIVVPTAMRAAPTPPTGKAITRAWFGFWHEWLEGIRLIFKNRGITVLFVVLMLMNFGGVMIDPLYPGFVNAVVGAGPQAFGWLLTTHAVGGIASSLLLGQFGRVASATRLLAFGSMAGGIICLVQFNLPLLPVTLTTSFLLGFPSLAGATAANALVLQHTPEPMRGRVVGALSTMIAFISLASVLGMSGALGEAFGIVPILNVSCAINVLAGLVALRLLPQHTPAHEPGKRRL